MKVTKSVTLNEGTARKAKEMDNFSLYIRECLAGDMHLKHEALKRRIAFLVEVIRIAHDKGSQHPDFKKACTESVFL